jgi:hypothetical protein
MRHVFFWLLFACLADRCRAVELKPETKKAFEEYVRTIETEMAADVAAHRAAVLPRLSELQSTLVQRGIVAAPFAHRKTGADASIDIPDGLINHWVGAVFVPNAKVADVRAVLQDYDNYSRIYAPDVTASKLVHRSGDDFDINLRLHRDVRVKALFGYAFPVEFNASYKVDYSTADETLLVRSISTRIAQVRDPKKSHTDEYPPDGGDGYLWRLNSYWRVYPSAKGVYVESEAVSLSRSVPGFVAKMVTYFTSNFPRESLESTLTKTKTAASQRS